MITEPVRRSAVIVLCVSLLGSCSLFNNVPLDSATSLAASVIPASMVAEGLSIVAFQGALKLATEVPHDKQTSQVTYVQDVIAKLLAHDPKLAEESADWSIHIIDSKTRDAVAFEGTGILVHSGLLACDETCLGKPKSKRRVKPKPNELTPAERVLAVALSHEISHMRAKHFEQRLRANAKLVKEATDAVQNALKVKAQNMQLPKTKAELRAALADLPIPGGALKQLIMIAGVSIAGELGGHPFMIVQEQVSDCQGTKLMQGAGYDPGDAVAFWGTTDSKDAGVFFPTHPRSPERLAELKQCVDKLPKAMAQEKKPNRVAAVSRKRAK